MNNLKHFKPGYIYVLGLRGKNIYIGETSNIKRRLKEHTTGLFYNNIKNKWTPGGSKMTREYSPINLIGLYRPWINYDTLYDLVIKNTSFSELDKQLASIRRDIERELTLHFMKLEGNTQVRGSQWTSSKNVSCDILNTFENIRPNCKCNIPAEKIYTSSGIEKWVCGSHVTHNTPEFELIPSTSGLLFQFDSKFSIPVALSCDYNETISKDVFIPAIEEVKFPSE